MWKVYCNDNEGYLETMRVIYLFFLLYRGAIVIYLDYKMNQAELKVTCRASRAGVISGIT